MHDTYPATWYGNSKVKKKRERDKFLLLYGFEHVSMLSDSLDQEGTSQQIFSFFSLTKAQATYVRRCLIASDSKSAN